MTWLKWIAVVAFLGSLWNEHRIVELERRMDKCEVTK